MKTVGMIGLMKMELPTQDVRLCDGGFIEFGAEIYRSADAVFGTIGSLDPLTEGVGDEVPALEMVLLPPEGSEPSDLSQPGFQTSRVRYWIAEYNPETGLIVGTPDLIFDGQLDRAQLSVGASRELALSIVSLAERLFEMNTGNSLNPTWHKSIWAGELGHDNATGLSIPIAWGAASPPTSGGSYANPGSKYQEVEFAA